MVTSRMRKRGRMHQARITHSGSCDLSKKLPCHRAAIAAAPKEASHILYLGLLPKYHAPLFLQPTINTNTLDHSFGVSSLLIKS